MTESLTATLFSYAFVAWFVLTVLTYAGIRAYLYHRGEPVGWRFNHHGARAFPGHLSFYERGGGGAVVLQPVHVFPLFWKVRRTKDGAYNSLETAKRAPVWSAIPWAFRWMGNYAVLDRIGD